MKKLSCPTRFKAYFIFVGITFLLMALMRIVFYFVNTMGYQEGVLKAQLSKTRHFRERRQIIDPFL